MSSWNIDVHGRARVYEPPLLWWWWLPQVHVPAGARGARSPVGGSWCCRSAARMPLKHQISLARLLLLHPQRRGIKPGQSGTERHKTDAARLHVSIRCRCHSQLSFPVLGRPTGSLHRISCPCPPHACPNDNGGMHGGRPAMFPATGCGERGACAQCAHSRHCERRSRNALVMAS